MKCTYLSFVLYVFHDIFIQHDFHIYQMVFVSLIS